MGNRRKKDRRKAKGRGAVAVMAGVAAVAEAVWFFLASLNEGADFIARVTGCFGTIVIGV